MKAFGSLLIGITAIALFALYKSRRKVSALLKWPVTLRHNDISFTFLLNSQNKGGSPMVQLRYDQEVAGALGSPVDSKGNQTTVEKGSVSFSSSDESVFVVEEDPEDEMKFKIVGKGPGVAQLTATADADLGEGVKEITGFSAVEVLPGEAVGFAPIFFSVPTDQPVSEAGEETGGETETEEGGETTEG